MKDCIVLSGETYASFHFTRNSDIWRDYPRFLVSIFRWVYLTNLQGCQTSVVAATITKPAWLDSCPYLQPYWLPRVSLYRLLPHRRIDEAVMKQIDEDFFFRNKGSKDSASVAKIMRQENAITSVTLRPSPVPEMLGPFVQSCWTTPCLPNDNGLAAAGALWCACENVITESIGMRNHNS